MKRISKVVTAMMTAALLALPALALAEGIIDLPRTGQTRCYDTAGKEIVCSGTGQDGALRAGAPIPSPRFVDNGDGTATDRMTGLIWLKNANCFNSAYWGDLLVAANALADGQCGLTDGSRAGDWRLPNKEELMSLINISFVNPALQVGHPFVNVQTDYSYWSSSSDTGGGQAWVVNMGVGSAGPYYKSNYSRIWPVRGGQ